MIKPLEDNSIYTDTMKENNTYHEHMEGPKFPKSLCVNSFSVPENYFKESARHIMAQVYIEAQASGTEESFVVPQGYFDQLQNSILAQTRIDTLSSENTEFAVPDHYFGQLSETIKNKIAEENLKAVAKDPGFAAPEGYFEQAVIQLQRTLALDPVVGSTSGGFTVKEDYFDQLTANITERISTDSVVDHASVAKETPVRRIGVNRWIKYASAACVAVILSLGVYFGLNSDTIPTTTDLYAFDEVTFGNISDDELMDYLAMNGDSYDLFYFAEYMDGWELEDGISIDVEDEDLEDYINYML